MRPDERDAACLRDMLEACRAIVSFLAGRTLESYLADSLLQAGVKRELETIVEAAWKVSETLRYAHPEIPWGQFMGLRRLLARDYGGIPQDRIWMMAVEYVPILLAQIAPLIPSVPPAPDARG